MKCPYCGRYFPTKSPTVEHMNSVHSLELTKDNMDAPQSLYHSTHNTLNGKCMCGCGKNTEWNFKTGKPFKVSSDPSCRVRLTKKAERNLMDARGITKQTMMSDMEHQKEMQKKRPTAGEYRFSDGGKVGYLSTLEHNFLQFCDVVADFKSSMIQDAPEAIEYYDSKDKRTRMYIPDYYLPDYNLLVEIKDGGANPNTNPAFIRETKYKVRMKDDALRNQEKYNFIKIVDKNYGPFIETLHRIIELGRDDAPKQNAVIVISETASADITNIGETKPDDIYSGLYLVVTKVPYLNMTESVSVMENYIPEWVCSVDNTGKVYVTDPCDDKFQNNLDIYKYVGSDQVARNAIDMVKVSIGSEGNHPFTLLDTLDRNGIMYDFGDINNNKQHQCDFIRMQSIIVEQ